MLVAEETKAGVKSLSQKRGLRSAGIAALLSACPLSTAAGNGFPSPVLRCWFRVLRCVPKAQPGHNVDVDSLHVSQADIFKSQMRAAGGSPTQ